MLVPFRGNGLSFGNPNFSFGNPITSSKGAVDFLTKADGSFITKADESFITKGVS